MRGHRDLERSAVAAVACALVAALVPWEIVRIVAALPLALFLPGYAIVAVAFGSDELALSKRLTLSVAVSLMVLALGALVLNAFPFGIRTASWAVLLAVVILAACFGAARRRGRPQSGQGRRSPLASFRPSRGSIAMLTAAVAIAAAALVLAQKPLPAKNAEGFTALWMLPTDAKEDAARVGVISSEQDPASYRLEVKVENSGRREYRLDLDPGQEESFEVEVPRVPGGRTRVVASLYREDEPQRLFRRVTRWLPRQSTFP
jgi:uncharacterized membrane protein